MSRNQEQLWHEWPSVGVWLKFLRKMKMHNCRKPKHSGPQLNRTWRKHSANVICAPKENGKRAADSEFLTWDTFSWRDESAIIVSWSDCFRSKQAWSPGRRPETTDQSAKTIVHLSDQNTFLIGCLQMWNHSNISSTMSPNTSPNTSSNLYTCFLTRLLHVWFRNRTQNGPTDGLVPPHIWVSNQ